MEISVSYSTDRIVSAFVEGVAAAQALQAQPDAFRRAMPLDRLHHVFGARRIITAGRGQQGRDEKFITLEARNQD